MGEVIIFCAKTTVGLSEPVWLVLWGECLSAFRLVKQIGWTNCEPPLSCSMCSETCLGFWKLPLKMHNYSFTSLDITSLQIIYGSQKTLMHVNCAVNKNTSVCDFIIFAWPGGKKKKKNTAFEVFCLRRLDRTLSYYVSFINTVVGPVFRVEL